MTGAANADADRQAVERLIVEFVWRVDHDRADTVHELFAGDGVLTLGSHHLEGRAAIAAWGETRAGQDRRSMHVCSNIRVELDGNTATATTYGVIYMAERGGATPQAPLSVGEYRDELVRVPEGWRFRRRRMVALVDQ